MNVLKLLVNPIFLLAVGLHAGLLMIPVAGGSSEDIVPAPDPEGESITVTRIPPKQSAKQSAKQSQPVTPVAGQMAKANRSTTAQVATTQASAASSAHQQQKSQGNARRQSNQDSGNRLANPSTSADGQTANRQSTSTTGTHASPGLPELPADPVSVTVSTQEPPTIQPAPTLAALKDGAESRVPDLLKAFLERLQYSLLKTREVEAEAAEQAWLTKLAEQSNIAVATPQALDKALEISYPITVNDNGPREIRRCLNPLPKPGLLGVVIDKDGAIAAEPTLLRSSGYPFLNDAALKRLETYTEFPEANSPRAYTVPVAINYDQDACIALANLSPDTSEARAANDR